MQLFPVSLVIVGLFLLAIRRGQEGGMFLAVALLPFGMTAFANLPAVGNLSLPAAEVVAGLTVGWMLWDRVLHSPTSLGAGLDRHGWTLALLGAYAVFSGTVLVRLFESDMYVFPLNETEGGLRVSPYFSSRVELLTSGATNFSQLCYLLFSFAFFFAWRAILVRRTTAFAHEALVVAAWINVGLGVLDAISLDAQLAFVRTAKYALLTTHQVQGFQRVIGGFPEASAYGGFSSVLTAYFVGHSLFAGSRRSALLAGLCATAAVLSFSSTAYLGLGVAGTSLLAGAVWAFLRRSVAVGHLVFLHVVALSAVVLVFVVLVTGLPELVVSVLDQLLFDKADSSSALERGAWAQVALRAFAESHYLGVGIGSLRGNGLVSVYLGSVGILGTALLVLFYLRVLTQRGVAGEDPVASSHRAIANAARLAVVTKLATAAVAATTPDPGLMMMLFCAVLAAPPIAVATRHANAPARSATQASASIPALRFAVDRTSRRTVPAQAEIEIVPSPFIDLGPGRTPLEIDILLEPDVRARFVQSPAEPVRRAPATVGKATDLEGDARDIDDSTADAPEPCPLVETRPFGCAQR